MDRNHLRKVHYFIHGTWCVGIQSIAPKRVASASTSGGGGNTQLGTVVVNTVGPPSGSVLVQVVNSNNQTVASAASSTFAFTGLQAGQYSIVVPSSVTGYTISQTSYPVNVEVGTTVTITVTYTATQTTPPPPENGTLYVAESGLTSGSASYVVTSSTGVQEGSASTPGVISLPAGSYSVVFSPVPNYTPTTNQTFTATITSGGSVTVTATYVPIVSTTPPPTGTVLGGLLFPAYQSSPTDAIFTTIINAKQKYGPSVPAICILNPNSGPVPYTAAWGTLIANLHNAGISVGLYVDTGSGPYTVAQMQSQVTSGYSGYLADYIFWDDFHAGSGGWTTSYATSLAAIANGVGMKSIANPGAPVPNSTWFDLMNIWCIYETASLPQGGPTKWTVDVQSASPYTGGTPSSFAVIGYSATFPTAFIQATMPSQIGWIYVTDNSNLGADYQSDTRDYLNELFQILDAGSTTITPPPVTTGTGSVTVVTINQTGTPITGYYVSLTTDAAGLNAVAGAYGSSPQAWTVPAGSYYLFAASYGSCTFTNFTNPVSSTNGVPITVGANTAQTFTAQYSCTGTGTTTTTSIVTISAVDTAGNALDGYYVSAPGAVPTSGYTPASFTCINGQSYTFTPQNYGVYAFSHWSDGVVAAARSETITSNLALVAVYVIT